GAEAAEVLPVLLATNRCRWKSAGKKGVPLKLAAARKGVLAWKNEQDYHQQSILRVEPEALTLKLDPPWYVDIKTGECGPIESDLPPEALTQWIKAPPLHPSETAVVSSTFK